MDSALDRTQPVGDSLDAIVLDLQQLRLTAGDVSYAQIAIRIAERRREYGANEAAARIARSTVFDAFREGRQRINPDLIAEIVLALGESDASAEMWRARCIAAQGIDRQRAKPLTPAAAPAASSGPAQADPPINAEKHHRLRTALIIAVVVSCVGINIFGNTVTAKFGLPVFLDMIGTAIASIALGPWYGVLVGLSTNLFATVAGSPISLAFSLVNIAGALVWGYGYHRFGMGRTHLKFFLLNVIAGVTCTIVAAPITVLLFDGSVTHASNTTTESLVALGHGVWAAVFSANLLSSLADKLISGYLALAAARVLAPLHLSSRPTKTSNTTDTSHVSISDADRGPHPPRTSS